MRTILICSGGLLLAVFTMVLPLTGANRTTSPETETEPRSPRKEAGTIRVAQGGPELERDSKQKRAATARQEAAEKRSAAKRSASTRSSGKNPGRNSGDAKSKRNTPITPEVEADVRAFVRQHHPELLDLLTHLKDNVPKEYEQAMRELNRHQSRLKQMEGRERYTSELQLWKAQSRARLLAARAQMDDDDSHREALREKLAEIYDLRAAILKRDYERTAERLKKLDEQLKTLRSDRERNLEKQLAALTKTAPKRGKSSKAGVRDAKPTSKTTAPVKKLSKKTIN